MIVIENKFSIGDMVYLITDTNQLVRLVLAIGITYNGMVVYELCCGTESSRHYDIEISETKSTIISVQ